MLVAYDVSNINLDYRISISVDNASVENVLSKALTNTDLSYRIMNRYIIITKSDNESLGMSQQRPISGKVTDLSGAPLPGVTVVIKGTSTGTITDSDGKYSLNNLPENASITIFFCGYENEGGTSCRQDKY